MGMHDGFWLAGGSPGVVQGCKSVRGSGWKGGPTSGPCGREGLAAHVPEAQSLCLSGCSVKQNRNVRVFYLAFQFPRRQ